MHYFVYKNFVLKIAMINCAAICNESFFRFKLFDCPGQIDFFHAPEEFGLTEKMRDAGAVIFVIDSQVL